MDHASGRVGPSLGRAFLAAFWLFDELSETRLQPPESPKEAAMLQCDKA